MAFAWSVESRPRAKHLCAGGDPRPCKSQRDLSSLLQSFPDLWAAMAWRREFPRRARGKPAKALMLQATVTNVDKLNPKGYAKGRLLLSKVPQGAE